MLIMRAVYASSDILTQQQISEIKCVQRQYDRFIKCFCDPTPESANRFLDEKHCPSLGLK